MSFKNYFKIDKRKKNLLLIEIIQIILKYHPIIFFCDKSVLVGKSSTQNLRKIIGGKQNNKNKTNKVGEFKIKFFF